MMDQTNKFVRAYLIKNGKMANGAITAPIGKIAVEKIITEK